MTLCSNKVKLQERGAVIHKRQDTGEGLTWGLGRNYGLDDAVLLSPMIEESKNLMVPAGEIQKWRCRDDAMAFQSLGPTQEIDVDIFMGLVEMRTLEGGIIWGLPSKGFLKGQRRGLIVVF
jgi:hypothetical protein